MMGRTGALATSEAFAPLPPATTDDARDDDDAARGRALLPVPVDAPKPPARHATRGAPSVRYAYRDGDGRTLHYVDRWHAAGDRRKVILPLTYREYPDGSRRWDWRAPEPPRPLYGLDVLGDDADKIVVVVEGEKAAVAAAQLLPEYAATTSSGGSHAAAKADWTALRGRRVVVLPDADAPGARYAADVARLAHAAGAASVAVAQLPDGLPDGWDLADPLPNGWDADTVCNLVVDAEPATTAASGDGDPVRHPFGLTLRGVYYAVETETDDGVKTEWEYVCSRLEVLALTRDANHEEWGRLLRVTDPDGNAHDWAMPTAMMAGDGTAYREELLRLGLVIAPGRKARDRLHTYIATTTPTARVRCVTRTGWHGDSLYVLPDAVFGSAAADRVRLQTTTAADHAMRTAGDLADWQRDIGAACAGNSRLAFAVSVAFAAPLLRLTADESGGFHFRGASSTGKTTLARVAASVCGSGADAGGYVSSWRATANGLEAVAAAHCDGPLILDELSQSAGKEAAEIAYMLANGSGKHRARRDGSGKAPQTWRLLFLSTGEIGLADKLRDSGQRATAGQDVRMVDIPIDAGAGMGAFDALHGYPDRAAFVKHLRTAAARTYGTAMRAYLAKLTADVPAAKATAEAHRQAWVAAHCPGHADGQVARVALRFGLVAAAGELATAFGILPWQPGEADAAAATCFAAWLRMRGTTGALELQHGLEAVRGFFETHGSSRFVSINADGVADDRVVTNRAGFRRNDGNGGTEWLVFPQAWRDDICKGFDARALTRAAVDVGWLVPAGSGKASSSHRLPGLGVKKVYHVTAAVIAGDPDDGGDRPA